MQSDPTPPLKTAFFSQAPHVYWSAPIGYSGTITISVSFTPISLPHTRSNQKANLRQSSKYLARIPQSTLSVQSTEPRIKSGSDLPYPTATAARDLSIETQHEKPAGQVHSRVREHTIQQTSLYPLRTGSVLFPYGRPQTQCQAPSPDVSSSGRPLNPTSLEGPNTSIECDSHINGSSTRYIYVPICAFLVTSST